MYLLIDLYDGRNEWLTPAQAKEWKKDAKKVNSKKGLAAWLGEEHYLVEVKEREAA